MLRNLENRLRTGRSTLGDRLEALLDENFALSKSLEESKKQKALNIGESVAKESTTVAGIQVVATRVDGDVKSLMSVYDDIRSRLKNYVIVLAVVVDERIHLVSGISKNLVQKMKAGELIEHVGSQIGARGGGKPEMARAGGGTNIAALPKALESVKDWVRERQSVETP